MHVLQVIARKARVENRAGCALPKPHSCVKSGLPNDFGVHLSASRRKPRALPTQSAVHEALQRRANTGPRSGAAPCWAPLCKLRALATHLPNSEQASADPAFTC